MESIDVEEKIIWSLDSNLSSFAPGHGKFIYIFYVLGTYLYLSTFAYLPTYLLYFVDKRSKIVVMTRTWRPLCKK